LIDRYAIVVLPSTDQLGVLPHYRVAYEAADGFAAPWPEPSFVDNVMIAKHSVIVMGNPDLSKDKEYCWPALHSAQAELGYAAYAFGAGEIYSGESATYSALAATLAAKSNESTDSIMGDAGVKLIYIASHGLVQMDNPDEGSFIALSDRRLTLKAIRQLQLGNARPLVVLSACMSGLGPVRDGMILSPAQAWYQAGASQVLMTLWSVDDRATTQLMSVFLDNVARDDENHVDWKRGLGTEFALARAIRVLKKLRPEPVYWASFTVYGEPSASE
jgi:CHAT domain-containing protein